MVCKLRLPLAALAMGAAIAASAQTYPAGPVRIVVPSAPGTQSDLVARAIAQRLAPVLGQPVLVDNRPGADGMLAVEAIVNAPADGLTLANVQSGSLTLAPTLYPDRVRYDPERDLAAITHTVRATFILTVNNQLPVKNIKELVAHTKANPRTGAIGHMPGVAYLGALVAKSVTQADVELIAYKGQPAIWTDLLGGRIHGGIEPLGGAFNQIRAGKLRAIALLGSSRSALIPDVQTATEQGFPGLEVDAWNALFARAGTPPAIIERLHREVVRILSAPDLKESMLAQGMELETSDPATLAQRVRTDRAKWAKLVKDFNVKAEN
jgi:tripartite-type tricarboxylate transporter receptor subunit TctC